MYPGRAATDKYERFENWLRENGARFDQLELREYDDSSNSSSASKKATTSRSSILDHDAVEEKKDATILHESSMESDSNSAANNNTSDDSELRGVHARTTIAPHTVIMSIPRRCLITVEMGQASPIGQTILHADLDLDAPKHIYLMIYLLWDRKVNGRNSFFWPYYEILPKTLSNMPIFWSPKELSWLQGSFLLQQIADRRAAIRADYQAICQVAPALAELCTLAEFSWARMCVCSRNFGLQMDGHRTSALVPHADMLNHYRPRETKWTFDEDRQAFTITALHAAIPAGAQVYDSYGQKCNHRFLLNYGFCVEDNRELDGFCPNEVPLELHVPATDAAFAEKLEFWTRGEQQSYHSTSQDDPQQQPPAVKRVRVCISNNENTRLLFSLLRALACTPAELRALASPVQQQHGTQHGAATTTAQLRLFGVTHMDTTGSGMTAADHLANIRSLSTGGSGVPLGATYHRSCRDIRHPVSLRNERAAMRLLLRIVEDQLAAYPTTLAQDLADLADEATYPRFSNRRHAKIQVRGEKQVLHHFQTWAQTALEVLDVMQEELQHEKMSLQQQYSSNDHASGGAVEVVAVVPNTTPTTVMVQPHDHHNHHGASATVASVSGATTSTAAVAQGAQPPPLGFECLIRRMEEESEPSPSSLFQQHHLHAATSSTSSSSGITPTHHTILRYCADVLGSLRREEFKSLRRQHRHTNLHRVSSARNRGSGTAAVGPVVMM